ncbi:hypothetical protein CARUB_v10016162mg [Capsella rubella]|uniref:Neprosin PEP catalytic domain-containing protein n=1 Tax=Capsella rubella TaxID=81985 RepID=R0GAW6_9BRAS|nr:uncharacterized protein LOC17893973 [Capsella rubella]EOA32847.1 hypothetical protein CARUB_v10016162mg [Capsella rubella]
MRSSTRLILLILSTITLILVTESRRTIPSEEGTKELEKLLNHINKPVVKSFQTKHGYILDCIDIRKQLAFDHPLLKNHSIQLKPTSIPKWTRDNNTSPKSSSLPFRQDDDISCPLGTVVIKRATLEDLIQMQRLKSLGFKYPFSKDMDSLGTNRHHFAIAQYFKDNYGAKGNINIWDPSLKHDQFSLASISIESGLKDTLQSISAGWIVSPKLNQNHSGLYTYWTANGYKKTAGCYNTLCPGFVQVSRKFALGGLAEPVSIYDGQQYQLEIGIHQDNCTGDWWFVLQDEPIGYWPKSLFHSEGLANGASRVFWGGEVFSSVKKRLSPIMGSGHFPQDGFKKAAFVNGLKVIDHVSKEVTSPTASDLVLFANSPACYNVQTASGVGEDWSTAIFFGGPGGCSITS